MKANIHTSKYDILYCENKSNILIQLEKEFNPIIEQALDKEYAKGKISAEIDDRIHKLCTDHYRDVKNYFKKDLIDNIDSYLKLYRENPIANFIDIEVPKLIIHHKEWMKGSEHSYSFDKDFIKAKPEQIIALITESKGLKGYKDSLFPIIQHRGRLTDPIKLNGEAINIQIRIKTLYDHLYLKAINVTLEEFSKHFQPVIIPDKIKWELTEPLVVSLFNKLKENQIISNSNIYHLISDHFTNQKNKAFKPEQLEVVDQKSARQTTRNQNIVDQVISELKKLT